MIKDNFHLLIDKHIYLRCLKEKDATELFKLVDSNRKYLSQFLGWLESCLTEEDSLHFIKKENSKKMQFSTLTFGIFVSDNLEGVISLDKIDYMNNKSCIGYWIAENKQNQNIVTRCVNELIKFSFKELKIHRIEIHCAAQNYKSQKIPQRLGFEKEGILKEAIYNYGNYFDAYLYALINKKPII